MGTRSVIAATPADAARGRYVHWDGYPTGVGQALLNIVRRDGLDKAREVLTREHFGWSSVTGEGSDLAATTTDDGRFVIVPGYGLAYSHDEHKDAWAQSVHSEEWGYILGDDGLHIVGHAHIPWTDSAEAQTSMLNAIEGA